MIVGAYVLVALRLRNSPKVVRLSVHAIDVARDAEEIRNFGSFDLAVSFGHGPRGLRFRVVEIAETVFHSFEVRQQIDEHLQKILGKAGVMEGRFEQAFFVMLQS